MINKEVLYLSYDGMTDPLGQSQVIPYLAGLSKAGYHFHLVSFEKKVNYDSEHLVVANLLREHNITWHPISYTKSPPILSTLYDLYRIHRKGFELVRKHNIRIVHCRSYISALAGLSLKRKTGASFIFDMRGFWADERLDGGLWNLTNPIYKFIYNFFKKKEKLLISGADVVVSLTENAKKEIDSWKLRTASAEPIHVIPCCADLSHFNPASVLPELKQRLFISLNLPEKSPVISYLGTIGTWYLLDEMLEFFKQFLQSYPGAVFLFITQEPPEKIIDAAAKKEIPETALRFFSAKRSEVPAALSLSDISIFFIKSAFSKKASSPTKQGEIMGMGIPVICNSGIGDTDYVIANYGCGITINISDENAIGSAIKKYDMLKSIPSATIIAGAADFYSLDSGVAKYLAIYKKFGL